MGADMSKPSPPDPCSAEIEAYLKCVDARQSESGGLRDGDECEEEGVAYRECRRKARETKKVLQKQG